MVSFRFSFSFSLFFLAHVSQIQLLLVISQLLIPPSLLVACGTETEKKKRNPLENKVHYWRSDEIKNVF